MKVQELVERFNKNDFNMKKELEIKKYIPVMEKRKFAIGVIAACTDDVDGYITVDRFKMDIYFHMNLLKLYTNLEVTANFDEIVLQYDILCECGLLGMILDVISDDYDILANILEYELDSILEENSLECQTVKVVSKVNDIIDIVGNKIKDVDFNSLLPEGVDVKQLLSIVNMLK